MTCVLLNSFGYLFTKGILDSNYIYLSTSLVFQTLLHIIFVKI